MGEIHEPYKCTLKINNAVIVEELCETLLIKLLTIGSEPFVLVLSNTK